MFRHLVLIIGAALGIFASSNANQAPVLAPIGGKSTSEGQLLQFRVSATDPDATIPALSAVGLPLGAVFDDSLNGAGSFNWTPTFSQAGAYQVTFIADDGSLADSERVVISVSNANQAPVLAPIGPRSTNDNQLLEFRVSAIDPDGTVPFLLATNRPPGAVFMDSLNGAGAFSWTPTFDQSGIYNVTFAASDGGLSDFEVVTITVNNVNRAPLWNAIGNKTVDENQLLAFNVSASDPDGPTPTLQVSNLPSGATFVDSTNGRGRFSWTPTFTQSGNYNLNFIASDGVLADTDVVTITVNNANRAPALAAIGAKTVNENQLLQFRVSATDPDGTVPSLSAVSLPSGATFNDSLNGAGSFAWTPTFSQSGTYGVTFLAFDGSLADTETVTITVNQVNAPPVLGPVEDKAVLAGQQLVFTVSASDLDGTIPQLSAPNRPIGAAFNDNLNGTGGFSWVPSLPQVGIYAVIFIASDGALADSGVVNIRVVDPSAIPKGDLNLDGVLTASDVVLILNCAFLGVEPPAGPGSCDLNCDSLVTSPDVVLELNAVFLGAGFPC